MGWAALSSVCPRPAYSGVAEVSGHVKKSHHRKGFGRILLRALCTSSEQSGYWTLQSQILQENVASIYLHQKCGFRTVGCREEIARDRFGVWRNTYLVERRVAR